MEQQRNTIINNNITKNKKRNEIKIRNKIKIKWYENKSKIK